MECKNNFILYTEYYENLQMLTNEQKGILLDSLFLFQMDEPIPELDPVTKMAFAFISSNMRRNNEKYVQVAQKRREAGQKGGKQKVANQANATFATTVQANQANANDNVNVNVNVKDNVNDNDNVSVNVNVPDGMTDKNTTHHIPTSKEVISEAEKAGCSMTVEEAENFIGYNDQLGWRLSWQFALKRWISQREKPKEKKKIRTDPSESHDYDIKELARRAKDG